MRTFLRRIQNDAQKYSSLRPGTSFIVGVSGGPDSLCLLDTLFLLSKKHNFKLHIAHVNYRLRSRASDRDETLVRKRASLYGLPCTVLHPKKKTVGNVEEYLRDTRYAYFEKLRHKKKYDFVAVAHNKDDQAETFLLRLLRGSGLTGLQAMRPKQGVVVRPFLETSRADILRYLKERHLPFREDKSNSDTKFLRNRIRHKLLPLLEKEYQPQIKKLLANTATLLSDDAALLALLPVFPFSVKKRELAFSRTALLAAPEPLAKRHLRDMFQKMHPRHLSPSAALLGEMLKALKSSKSKTQTISLRGLKLVRKGDRVTLLKLSR